MDLSDDEIEEYEQQLEETDVKAVLIDIASTNRQILNQLYLLNQKFEGPKEETGTYTCDMCGETITEDKRRRHMDKEHNAPSTIELESVYTRQ